MLFAERQSPPRIISLAHVTLDTLPTDKQTLEDYGFNKAYTSFNQMMLLGLYQGLFKYLEHQENMEKT